MKISQLSIIVFICIFFTAFQMILSSIWIGFSYTDEILAVICFFVCLLHLCGHKNKLYKLDRYSIFVLFFLLCTGIIGNIISGIQTRIYVIALDIIATFKNFIIYYAFRLSCTNPESNYKTIHSAAKFCRIYVVVCALFAFLNIFLDIQMSSGYDFGLKNFQFIFKGAGNYAMVFYVIAFAVLIDISMKDHASRRDKSIIILMLFAMAASLTTRSLAYVAIFFLMYAMNRFSRSGKLKIWQLVLLAALSIAIGFSTITYYFSANRNTARGVLLRYSFKVLSRYFPVGSGFSTYASNMAAQYYSDLYSEFGFNSVWGLAANNPKFANDSFWPEVIGQFGFIGIVFFGFFLALLYKKLMNIRSSKNEKTALQWVFFVYLIGSTGTKTYIHFVTTGFFILLALYENIYKYGSKPPN